jgi:hypothetical protein
VVDSKTDEEEEPGCSNEVIALSIWYQSPTHTINGGGAYMTTVARQRHWQTQTQTQTLAQAQAEAHGTCTCPGACAGTGTRLRLMMHTCRTHWHTHIPTHWH